MTVQYSVTSDEGEIGTANGTQIDCHASITDGFAPNDAARVKFCLSGAYPDTARHY